MGCSLSFLLLSYGYLVYPIQQQRHQIEATLKHISQQQNNQIMLPQSIVEKIESPISPEFIISALSNLGEKYNLSSLDIKPNKRKINMKIIIDRFNVSAKGSFFQIMKFNQEIFSSPWLMMTPSFEMKKLDTGEVELNATLEVYHL